MVIVNAGGGSGTNYSSTSTISNFQDVPWVNITVFSQTITVSQVSLTVRGGSTTWSNLEQGGGSISAYQYELSTDGGTTWTSVLNKTGTTQAGINNYVATVPSQYLNYNTAYTMRYSAWNACGKGRWPSTSTFSTLATIPKTVPTPTMVVNTGSNITITWTAVPNTLNDTGGQPVTAYYIRWNATKTMADLGEVSATTLSYTITNVTSPVVPYSTLLAFALIVGNSVGNSTQSTQLVLNTTTPPTVAMAAPTVVLNCQTITLSWATLTTGTGGSPATNYNLYFKTNNGATNTFTLLTTGGWYQTLSFVQTWGTAYGSIAWNQNALYNYIVAQCNEAGCGPNSTALNVLTSTIPTVVGAPSIPAANILPASINITWTPLTTAAQTNNCTISGYHLQYCQAVSGSCSAWTTLVNTTSSFYLQQSDFNAATSYIYRLTAFNYWGPSASSGNTTISTCTLPTAAPTASCGSIFPTNMTVSWTSLASTAMGGGGATITYYQLEWQDPTNSAWTTVNTNVNSLVNSATITNPNYIQGSPYTTSNAFTSGSLQYFRVSAYNGVGQGPYSTTISCTACSFPTVTVTGLAQVTVRPLNVTVSWSAVATGASTGNCPIIFYAVELSSTSSTSGFVQLNSISEGLYTQYTHMFSTPFPSATNLYYRVRANNGLAYTTAYSSVITVVSISVPNSQTPPVLVAGSVRPYNISLTWSDPGAPANGGDPIAFFLLQFYDTYTSDWVNVTTYPTSGLVTSITHVVTQIFNPAVQAQYQLKSMNGAGWSNVFSTILQVQPCTVATAAPTLTGSAPHPMNMTVTWSPLTTGTGGDAPIYYQVSWYDGSNWVVMTSPSAGLKTSYTLVRTALEGIFPSGSTQQFKIQAENNVGLSTVSNTVSITACTEATAAPTLTGSAPHPMNMTVTWSPLTTGTGGDDPIYYQVSWYDGSNWVIKTSFADGLQYSYTYVRTVLEGKFPSGSSQQFKIQAQNNVGLSTVSNIVAITACTEPTAAPTVTISSIVHNQISITWTALSTAQNGGNPVTSYSVECDFGTGIYLVLASLSASDTLTYTTTGTSVLTPNTNFNFKVRALNDVGYGPYGTAVALTCNYPQSMTSPTLFGVWYNQISLNWTSITSDAATGRCPIIYYELRYKQTSGATYTALTTSAAGLTYYFDHVLTSGTFPNGSTVYYTICAENGVGMGACSADFAVDTCSTPLFMNTPSLSSTVLYNQIQISWSGITLGTHTGRSPVTYYEVRYKSSGAGTYQALTTSSIGVTNSYTHTLASGSFPNGGTVYYTICAENMVGMGACSDDFPVNACSSPLSMTSPTLSGAWPQKITINWSSITLAAQTGGSPVIYYEVRYKENQGDTYTPLTTSSIGLTYSYDHIISSPFPANKNVYYTICAKNMVDMGACSADYAVLTCDYPQFMNPPVYSQGDIKPPWIYLTWSPISLPTQNGRAEIIFYDLMWDEASGGTNWVSLTTGTTLIEEFNHTIWRSTFPSGQVNKYKLRAKNGVGLGANSTVISVTCLLVPQRLNTPGLRSITYFSISFGWAGISSDADDGGDPVNYYQVDWYQRPCYASDYLDCALEVPDQGQWVTLSTKDCQGTKTVFTHYAGHFHPGTNYVYRVCGWNGVGLGACSSNATFKTTDAPSAPPLIANTSLPLFNQISLKWSAMGSNNQNGTDTGNDPVLKYRVQWDNFQYKNPLYDADPINLTPWVNLTDQNSGYTVVTPTTCSTCSGSNNYGYPECTSGTGGGGSGGSCSSCPSSYTYTHTVNPTFQANSYACYRVQAINSVGYGVFHTPVCILTANVPDAPPSFTIPQANIYAFWISTTWTAQSAATNGWSPILAYQFEWDAGNSNLAESAAWTILTSSMVYTYNLTNSGVVFPNNTYYRFRLATKNGVGLGPYTPVVTILSARTPLQPSPPTLVSVAYNSIKIQWSLITNYDQAGRDTILNYKVQYNPDPDPLGSTAYQDIATVSSTTTSYTHSISTPFPAYTSRADYDVRYRLLAKNNIGWGIESFDLFVETCTYPRQQDQVVLIGDITPINIVLNWTVLNQADSFDTGNDSIDWYLLQWQVQGASTWITLQNESATNTDGQFTVTWANGWVKNTYYDIIVTAINNVGAGAASIPLTILTDNTPTYMYTLTEDPSTNATFINVTWEPLLLDSYTGRDPIIYYKLEWDQGNGGGPGKNSWVTLTTPNISVLYFTMKNNDYTFTNGSTYLFRVWPLNKAGYGAVSSTLSVIPSSPPDRMVEATTQICAACTFVKVSWTPPQTNGAAITKFNIHLQAQNGTYIEALPDCDGTDPVILAQAYCNIYNVTMRAAPFSLVKGTNIRVIVNAANLKGFNASHSPANTPTNQVETEPVAGPTPTRVMPPTTYNLMRINIPALSGTNNLGGATATISSYHIQRDSGNGSSPGVWIDMRGFYPLVSNDTSSPYTNTTDIIGGTTYLVRTRALNKYGWGPWGTPASIRCASPPNAPPSIMTANSSIYINISWTEPFNNGLNITAYRIQILKNSGTAFLTNTAECDGANNQVLGAMSCLMLMTSFRQTSTFAYPYNAVPLVQVAAINAEGTGPYTNSSGGAAIQTQPLAPTGSVSNVFTSTDDTQIVLQWPNIFGIANWGGYIISTLEVWWTNVNNDFPNELLFADNYPFALTFTVTNDSLTELGSTRPLVPGMRYIFKYRAVNIFGPGLFSPISYIYASYIPDKLAPPSTTLYNSTVTIAWTPTPNFHGQAVSAYKIQIQAANGSFVEDTSICQGSKAAIVAAMQCTAQMNLFVNNLGLGIGNLITLQISAYNVMGWSVISAQNTAGVSVKKAPQTAPSNLQRGANTAKTVIQLTWTGITADSDTGGQAVDYIVYFDKGTAGATWYTLTPSTGNQTAWTDTTSWTMGKSYQFKVAAYNDFGTGPQSTNFTIYAAIPPSGQGNPITTLNLLSYALEDDVVVISWTPPTDNGGLAVSYILEVLSPNGTFTVVTPSQECSENGWITNYFTPTVLPANVGLQCTMLVSTLISKYGIEVNGTVMARVSSFHIVGSTTSLATGSGTAVIPQPPCYRTTFPRIFGGSQGPTSITAMDIDTLGNIVVGGNSRDQGLLGAATSQSYPIAAYIAKGDYYLWANQIKTTDGATQNMFTTVLDVALRYDGQKVLLSLDYPGYVQAYLFVVLNADGSLFGAFKEGNNQRGKVNITSMLFDSSNTIIAALDLTQDGTSTSKLAAIIRFSANNPAAASIAPGFYIQGGAASKLSQAFLIKRIYSEATSFYATALLQDANSNRRALIAKMAVSTGTVQRYFQYQTSPLATAFNTDLSFAAVRRWSLYEDDVTTTQIIGACIITNDGSTPYFGQFIFATSQSFTVLSVPGASTWYCLGMFQRQVNTAYVMFNDRSAISPSGYALQYGLINYSTRIINVVPILAHSPPATYFGAYLVHSGRVYYFGDAQNIVTTGSFDYPQKMGFINIYDLQETPFSCSAPGQIYNFTSGVNSINMASVTSTTMPWITTGLSSGPTFSAATGKTFRTFTLTGGMSSINLNEPLMNNTYCPVVPNSIGLVNVFSPTIATTMLSFNPDAASYPPQYLNYNPFTINQVCPDQVYYYTSFLETLNTFSTSHYTTTVLGSLPGFMTFAPTANQFVFNINSSSNVGTYQIIMQSTIGNNKTSQVQFQVQVSSPCLGLTINIPALAGLPTYDISALSSLNIPLNWDVQNLPTPSCGNIYFIFKLLNATDKGPADPSFSIVNNTSGVQQLKVWTQQISKSKLWTDIEVQAYLQGDWVQTFVFSINITNKCAVTEIVPNPIEDQIYYIGRDPLWFIFAWSEIVGFCGPISYSANASIIANPSYNNSLNSLVFQYPQPGGGNNTLSIYTWDLTQVGTYIVRVWGSLGVGGYVQASTSFTVQVISDPCSYLTYYTPFVPDLTLWVNQTNQIVNIPPFYMNISSWICNFTYVITDHLGVALDSAFVVKNVALQGEGTNITLLTSTIAKTGISPQQVMVVGWPNRQNTTSLSIAFRIFVAYQYPDVCTSGQYYDNVTTLSCIDCTSPCSQCRYPGPNVCTWCITGYTYIEATNTCIQNTQFTTCPIGTITDNVLKICRACPTYCSACSDIDTCTACVSGYSLADGACYPKNTCGLGFRFDAGIGCSPCPANCGVCSKTSSCSVCMDNWYLDTATQLCTQNCPAGYYGDAISKVCMQCSPACATCVTNNYTCTSCKPVNGEVYYLFKNTCVTRCPYKGYFQNAVSLTCDACSPACMMCIAAIDDCIVCNPGSVISGRSCLNSCPAGSYITPIGTCFSCDPACAVCSGALNSMCSLCKPGYYLTDTTCDSSCMDPLFADNSTGTGKCVSCQYYCNSCTTQTNCMKCATGYQQIPQNCAGEMFIHLTQTQQITVPINTALVPTGSQPQGFAVELWFKADDVGSINLQVLLGLTPYKLRKKAGLAQVLIEFKNMDFCATINLVSKTWYHYAFSLTSQNGGSLNCYLNGETLNVGQTPVSQIATNIFSFTEISFGTSTTLKPQESPFTGYIREFRWWKNPRSQFQFRNFKTVDLSKLDNFSPPNQLLAYWKLNEDRNKDTLFRDSASKGSITYDPTTAGLTVYQLMEMREIYLKFCPEGTYTTWNDTLGYYDCTECSSSCGNCNGPTEQNCTSCISPYKLLETDQLCIISASCPQGYWQDSNQNCWPCHPFCSACYGASQYQCTACNIGYFKAYKRQGCVNSCPLGLYGNIVTQACGANPVITSLYPLDGSVFNYGTYIDLVASFQLLNNEAQGTYWYGWIISKLGTSMNLATDAAKEYANTDITRVHLDNNIINPNNYYNITFYVQGGNTYYNGMLGYSFNVIYIGIPPKGGLCIASPMTRGIAAVTTFTFETSSWIDPDGISEYRFAYSLDGGNKYFPIESESLSKPKINFIFPPIFSSSISVKLECNVKSLKGLYASSYADFPLYMKTSLSSSQVLDELSSAVTLNTEAESLNTVHQVMLIANNLGSLKPQAPEYFAPSIQASECNTALCSFNGECIYLPFTKQYYCNCTGSWFGRNCSFQNTTQLEMLQNLTVASAKAYSQYAGGDHDLTFLQVTTQSLDVMTDDLLDIVSTIVAGQVMSMDSRIDTEKAGSYLRVLSNMLEYTQYQLLNVTMAANTTITHGRRLSAEAAQVKVQSLSENLNKTTNLVDMIRQSTLYKLSFINTKVSLSSRMVSYTQYLTTSNNYLSMPATSNVPAQDSTYVKLSPANFLNTTIPLKSQFIAEAVEYAINPYQVDNQQNLASGIIDLKLYNQNRTEADNVITRVEVANLTRPINFFFPVSSNANLTKFMSEYNALSSYRNTEAKLKEELLKASGLTCLYWNSKEWSPEGCSLASLTKTHVVCACTHLSTFSINFTTPVIKKVVINVNNLTVQASSTFSKTITIKDIAVWPLDAYLKNLAELWEHNRPTIVSFLLNPGLIVALLFWVMYFSSLIYYSGRDDIKRDKMTKSQIRDDLAEMKDDQSQHIKQVVRDLVVNDFLLQNGKYIAKEARKKVLGQSDDRNSKYLQPPQIRIYEELSKDEKKKYKKRARKKVFGLPGGLCDRARRYYSLTMKHNSVNPNAKMSFFNEELKNNLWIGLIAKTSKIAPRHVRLLLMYFYAALFILMYTVIFAFNLQTYISSSPIFQLIPLAVGVSLMSWIIGIPVALILRMPMELRRHMAGVRTKKINKAFREVDALMGWRYAFGYFICFSVFVIMTLAVLVLNTFYPQDYVIGWAFNIIVLYLLDLILFTFGLAGLQMANVMISQKVKCWYNVWAAIEVFRYVKNLRG